MKRTEWIVSVANDEEIGVIESAQWIKEIVRCEDCEYFGGTNNPCGAIGIYTKPEWFCSDGEQKDS